jgi:hypothetical protein
MRLTLKIGKVLIKLLSGYTVTFSSAKSALINELISENILCQKGKHHKSIQLRDKEALKIYLSNQLQINDLEGYIHALEINKNATHEAPGSGVFKSINRENILQAVKTLSLSQQRKFTR